MRVSIKFKRLITVALSGVLLASAPVNLILAQNDLDESSVSNESSVLVEGNENVSELQLALEKAIELFNQEFPEAKISEIDIELNRDNTYEIKLEGQDGTNEYELEFNSGTEEVQEREIDDDDDADHELPLEDLLTIDEISAIALEEVGFGEITDWHLEHDDDSDLFVWDLEIKETNTEREAEIEINALTGEIIDLELED